MDIRVCVLQFAASCVCQSLYMFSVAQVLPCRVGNVRLFLAACILSLFVFVKRVFGLQMLPGILVTLSALVVLGILVIRCFGGSLWKRILVSLFFLVLSGFADALFLFMVGFDTDLNKWSFQEAVFYFALSLPVLTIIYSVAVMAFRMVMMQKFQPFYLLYLAFPFSHFLLLYYNMIWMNRAVWVAGAVIGLASDMVLLVYTASQERKTALENELKESRHIMELERAHYQAVEARREELSRIRHDFNNQLAVIGHLIHKGEEEDARQIISRLAADINHTRENDYCGIPVVDAVLTEKGNVCEQAGIRLETELDLPRDMEIEPLHLCSIFSNLLDNAIQGARASGKTDPVISLRSRREGDYVFIRVENPAAPPDRAKRRRTETGHGYGTRILTGLAEQYGGGYEGFYENGSFTAMISLLERKM